MLGVDGLLAIETLTGLLVYAKAKYQKTRLHQVGQRPTNYFTSKSSTSKISAE